jgi:hypothetical protein
MSGIERVDGRRSYPNSQIGTSASYPALGGAFTQSLTRG